MDWLDARPSVFFEHPWGTERVLINNEFYCGKILIVKPTGFASAIHYHERKTETLTVRRGRLFVELADAFPPDIDPGEDDVKGRTTYLMVPNTTALTICPRVPHRFWSSVGDGAEVLAISSLDAPYDTMVLFPAGNVPASRELKAIPI